MASYAIASPCLRFVIQKFGWIRDRAAATARSIVQALAIGNLLASVSLFLYGRILIPVIMMLVLAVFSAEVFHSARRGARKIVFVYVFLVGLIAGISIVYASALSPIQYTSCSLYDNKETCTSLTSAWSQIFVFASIALALEAATLGFVGCVVVVRDDPTPEDLWLGA